MKKTASFILAMLFIVCAFCSCAENKPVTTEPESQTTAETTETEETEPVYVYPSENDNYAGTPAYTADGDKIIVDGVSYPNNKNMTNGITYAIDDLGREVRITGDTFAEAGTRNVGLFYFLWIGEHGDHGALDMTKIVEEGGKDALKASYKGWGPVGAMHFWGEPLYGYYYSSDKWVMRKHIEMLTLAEVDFLYLDVTNAQPYLSNAASLMKIIQEFHDQGFNPPRVVFYTNSQSAATVNKIYSGIYKNGSYPDAWYYLDGKPLIIAFESECRKSLSAATADFFSYREPQWPNERQKKNAWPWMDFTRPQRVFKTKDGEKEAISVSVAQHSGTIRFSDSAFYGNRTNCGRSYHNKKNDDTEGATLYGYNFQEQWDRAIKADVPYVLVTGWNEWVAQRQPSDGSQNNVVFVDTASMEYSRDIEPMRDGYFDNYYMQLIDNIRRYKGLAPTLVQDTRKIIDLDGEFSQWDDILVTYTDPTGDCEKRRSRCFGNDKVEDDSGNNDLRNAKVTHDTKYLYFYIDVPETYGEGEENYITAHMPDTSWMQIFINTDMNAETGFYGFDYIINNTVKDNKTSTLAKATSNGKEYAFEDTADIDYRIKGTQMMIRVALEDLGIKDYSQIKFAFKWVDSNTKITTMEQMYSEGDCAPLGRLSYVFQNYK